jgi:AraC-like DNA-binding protein
MIYFKVMVKQNVHEVIDTGEAYAWFNMTNETGQYFHCHAEYEIFYFIQGDIECRIEGRPYTLTPESLMLIPPNNMHGIIIKSTKLYKRVTFHFLPNILDEAEQKLFLGMFKKPCRYFPDISGIKLNEQIEGIKGCEKMEGDLKKTAFKHRLISLLADVYQLSTKAENPSNMRNERVNAILQYLNSNLTEDISLEHLSQKFYISKNYLNLLFNSETGMTVHRYLQLKRLNIARQEIRKGLSIEEAAYKAGFRDYSNFYRAYKSFFGTKPSASRQNENYSFSMPLSIPESVSGE